VIERRVGPVRVVFTDRRDGVSRGPYASCNLGDHVGDDPGAVAENRRALAATLSLPDPGGWVWLRQVHGAAVVTVTGAPASGGPPEADAAVTTRAGLALVVLTADCAPIALCTPDAVAVVHAGWPGLLAGVVGAAVDALRVAAGGGEVRAVLGPCVHPARYEFGAADLARVVDRFGDAVAARTDGGRPALDIPAAVRIALAERGVNDVDDVGVCTSASADHFSHRRDGVTGRQALIAMMGPSGPAAGRPRTGKP
jgi:YfiH family protein